MGLGDVAGSCGSCSACMVSVWGTAIRLGLEVFHRYVHAAGTLISTTRIIVFDHPLVEGIRTPAFGVLE
jgi:hypothetical protein